MDFPGLRHLKAAPDRLVGCLHSSKKIIVAAVSIAVLGFGLTTTSCSSEESKGKKGNEALVLERKDKSKAAETEKTGLAEGLEEAKEVKVRCKEADATEIYSALEKSNYSGIIAAVHRAVMNHARSLAGKKIKVRVLVCPPGNKPGSASLIEVSEVEGQVKKDVENSIKASIKHSKASIEISEPKKLTVIVPIPD